MMNSEEIREILNKLSNRKQETLLQGLRECQLKNIDHPFITKEEYIDKILIYIEDLQERIDKPIIFILEIINISSQSSCGITCSICQPLYL